MEKHGKHLAIDIGASGGRHMIAFMEGGKITLKEIYRFENEMTNKDGKLVWDLERLFGEILNGMKKCFVEGLIPDSMAIDTWAVDYVLLDEDDRVIGDTFGYRDKRTKDMDKEVYESVSEEKLYERTGIQKQIFNTIYQLTADRVETPEKYKKAKTFLMLPDYFNFLLTGAKKSEYTNATSTNLVSPETGDWDRELIRSVGLRDDMFLPLSMPGSFVGTLKKEIIERVGFDCDVLMCASHDTASAVMSVPAKDKDFVYISSGTWSLMGTELMKADRSKASRAGNFTNEGGYGKRYRYLKNIMGLWMIQSVRKEIAKELSYSVIAKEAENNCDFGARVDVADQRFFAPESMVEEIQDYCRESNQPIPKRIGQIAAVVYKSLAISYANTVKEIEANTGKSFDSIYIVGGGSNADYLNRLTAKLSGKRVYAGPGEATAIGNAMAQMLRAKEFSDIDEARECVYKSFGIKEYLPE